MGQSSPSKPTIVIVHGWEQSANSSWVILAKDTHLSTADKNIITLDWSEDAQTLDYVHAANAVPQVGAYLAQQFHQWISLNLVDLSTTRFVGFSLGAHVIGFCGQKYQNLTGGQKLRYLIGLEPAAPSFVGKQTDQRLDKTDGDMVQVFHTSITGIDARCGHVDVYFSNTDQRFYKTYGNKVIVLHTSLLGINKPISQVDFNFTFTTPASSLIKMQNCAVDQPGCPEESGLPTDNKGFQIAFCNHLRAVAYYIISITSSNFLAAPCYSCSQFKQNGCDISAPIVVGDQLNLSTKDGAYYLRTSSEKPFAEGIAGLLM